VAEAFKSGAYDGKQFSGKHGDLGAALAAVMLHSDAAQFESGVAASTQGCLREPLLKVIHMMRSMEYQDGAGDPVMFRELQDLIGQYPFQAPSVFNFYHADFELPIDSVSEPEPEVEAEAEVEAEGEYGAVLGPEFEIFTPFFFTNYINVMFSIISRGVSFECDGYYTVGLNAAEMVNGYWSRSCPQGTFTWEEAVTANETITRLDLLLTGGRLAPRTRELVLSAYTSAQDGAQLQEAQRAIAMSAEFNTLGNPLPLDTPRVEVPEQEVKSSLRPYKALVYLFFDGGADTFNLLVPQNCPLYDEYVETRTDLALTPAELHTVTTAGQNCSQFGIHSSIPILKTLFDMGEATFITNVGSLAAPLDMNAWKQGGAMTCYGLFSHSDQTNGAQTLKCQELGRSAKGFGGRIADALSSGGSYSYSSFAFSLAGTAIFPVGFETNRKIMTGEESGLESYDEVQHLISNITSQHHGNVYAEAFAVKFLDAVETTETERATRSAGLAGLATSYPAGSALENSFRTIASVIALRNTRGSERDTFYVSYGGWDMHSDLKTNMVTRLGDVNTALTSFVDELRAQSVWGSTVLLSASEFARTLDSNGGGSDHAWAGNHFVLGGALQGGKVLNRYPWTLKAGGPRDLGRGRLIPEFPWESIAVPIAEWMGVEEAQKDTVFPNVNAFHADQLIAQSTIFS
jgi:cullin-associated NEDD8-dissociated protein 1